MHGSSPYDLARRDLQRAGAGFNHALEAAIAKMDGAAKRVVISTLKDLARAYVRERHLAAYLLNPGVYRSIDTEAFLCGLPHDEIVERLRQAKDIERRRRQPNLPRLLNIKVAYVAERLARLQARRAS